MFRKYHYLNHEINTAARCFVCFANGQLAAFTACLPLPHPKRRNLWKIHRTVVFPDYQGIGIATKMNDVIAQQFKNIGKDMSIVTSNRAMIQSMKNNKKWACRRVGRVSLCSDTGKIHNKTRKEATSINRITTTFEYVG